MTLVLWILLAVFVLMVAVAPLIVQSTVTFSTGARITWLGEDDLPPKVLADLRDAGQAWVDRGFEPVADLFVQGFVTNVLAYRRLLVDADRTTVALVAVEVDDRRPDVRQVVMGLGSRLRRPADPDGYDWDEVSTTDIDQPSPPIPAGAVSNTLPDATPDELLAVHRRVLSWMGDRERIALGNPVLAATQDLVRSVDGLRQVGAVEPTGEPGEWKLTVAGAYRLTIPNLPGFLQVGRAIRRRRRRELIAEATGAD